MKKLASLFIVLLCLGSHGKAQEAGPEQQKPGGGALASMKVAFIAQRLNLSPEEGQKFWPVYNQYTAEIRHAHQAYKDHKNEIQLEETIVNIKKKYNVEFSKALTPERANQFFRAEKDFGAFVQKEMQRRQMRIQQRKPLAGEK